MMNSTNPNPTDNEEHCKAMISDAQKRSCLLNQVSCRYEKWPVHQLMYFTHVTVIPAGFLSNLLQLNSQSQQSQCKKGKSLKKLANLWVVGRSFQGSYRLTFLFWTLFLCEVKWFIHSHLVINRFSEKEMAYYKEKMSPETFTCQYKSIQPVLSAQEKSRSTIEMWRNICDGCSYNILLSLFCQAGNYFFHTALEEEAGDLSRWMWMFGSGWNRQLNCGATLVASAADLSQNISETEVAPDALVQKCSVFFTHAHGRI